MTILMLIVAFLFLLLNFKSYTKLFKSSEQINSEIASKFDDLSKTKNDKATIQLVTLVFTTIILIIMLAYYVIAGTMMSAIPFMILLSAILGVQSIVGIHDSIQLLDGKYKYRLYERFLVPVTTFFHCYFIYFLITN